MKRILYIATVLVSLLYTYSCNQFQKEEDTILTGNATVLVDETILPVIEDQVMVFENQYEAKIKLIAKSETEIVKLLSEGKYDLAILTRDLSASESNYFTTKKIKPRVTPIATDGIAFISNKENEKMQIQISEVIAVMRGEASTIQGLVFDNANSSTVQYFKKLAGVTSLPKEKIFSFQTNNEVISFVAKNKNMVGVVGVNWIMQPMPDFQKVVDDVRVLDVKTNNGTFAKPTQDLIASGIYPLKRELKMINFQGKTGLGMGFASFLGGEIGQRIILKSGLVPVRMPGRNIIIRKEIENNKKDN